MYNNTKLIHKIGRTTGHKINKIEELGLQIRPGKSIDTPYLVKAYAVIECQLYKSVESGDHTFFMGEITDAFGEKKAFDENGIIDLEEVEPALYIGKNRYATTSKEHQKVE